MKILLLSLTFLLNFPIFAAIENTPLSESEAEAIGTEIYIYGYPLVTMDMTRRVMTNVIKPEGQYAPMGQFANARTYPNASFKDVTAPNADTLYSIAWLELSEEPYILHLPDEQGRYYLMPLLSGWTDVIEAPGTRTTGTEAIDIALAGPDWKGSLPSGMKVIKSPTNMVWILGRTYCTGTPEDYKKVHEIQDQYSLTPLGYYGKPYTPPPGKVDPSIDMKTPVRDQVNQMDAKTFFQKLSILMKSNPPAKEDAPIVEKMAKIGMVPGKEFDMDTLDPKIVKLLEKSPGRGLEKIMSSENSSGKRANGWIILLNTGSYGTNYLERALTSIIGLGANRPEDAIYLHTQADKEGKPLNGKYKYVMHFPRGQLPPVKGFWSLTMYNRDYFFIENPINRYNISPRNDFRYNADGSLTLYIQSTPPDASKESNWLPSPPNDNFILMMRLYWPNERVLEGAWVPPPVEHQEEEISQPQKK